tara:strand:- start:90 stop:305 length:216 start_codon:yes stop_codon:yes gene_type:complete
MGLKIVTPFGKYQKGKRRTKKKKKAGTLYEGVDFSGGPTHSAVDMFGRATASPGGAALLASRRKKLMGGDG